MIDALGGRPRLIRVDRWIDVVDLDHWFRWWCCNQRLLIKILSSITDDDAPVATANRFTVFIVVAVAADPELCGRSTTDDRRSTIRTIPLLC